MTEKAEQMEIAAVKAEKAVKSAAKTSKAKTGSTVKAKTSKKTSKSGESIMSTKSSTFKKLEASFEPFVEYNKLCVESMESSYNAVMDSMQSYAQLGVDSMQAGVKVRSPEDMVSFYEGQNAMAQKASEMMMADIKSYSDMGVKFFDSMRTLYESSIKSTVSAATEAVKA